MRTGTRRRHQEEDEESAFVSMTDMTVSFLFILIILLAFFASQLKDEDTVARPVHEAVVTERDAARQLAQTLADEKAALAAERDALAAARDALAQEVARLEALLAEREARIRKLEQELASLTQENPLETYLSAVAAERLRILQTLQRQLKVDFPDLQVFISAEMDALRFKGDGLFQSGSSVLAEDKRAIARAIATRLDEILPCYTLGPRSHWQAACNGVGALIEAVQIEGHTDADGPEQGNMVLSTARANATFFSMTDAEPDLTAYRNRLGQPVLSVAGYGEMRPVADNQAAEGKATNRRIDLRLIMSTPSNVEEVAAIRAALRAGTAPGQAAP